MTNQNDASQAKLTDDQIEVLAKKHIARTPIGWTNSYLTACPTGRPSNSAA